MKTRVVAAIPCYNMGAHAVGLVQKLLEQDYDHIYVFDDCSTDNSVELLRAVKNERFSVVTNTKNIGAGPERNRILEFEQKGIVHFFDADVLPAEPNMPEKLRAAFERHPEAAALGLRVRNPDGSQYEHNYGPLLTSPWFLITIPFWKAHKAVTATRPGMPLKKVVSGKRVPWNAIPEEDGAKEQKVGAIVECNMAVRLEDFKKAGGFSDYLRFHEIHHLALNLRKLRKTIWYVPICEVYKHDYEEVRPHRRKEIRQSSNKLFKDKLLGRYR